MLAVGVVMAFLSLLLPPPGEINESVLYIFAQILIYAGSVFGIGAYVEKMKDGDRPHEPPPRKDGRK